MDTDEKRQYLIDHYPDFPSWKRRVMAFSDEQVEKVYSAKIQMDLEKLLVVPKRKKKKK